MIDADSWATHNGQKLHIMLEEAALKYRLHPVDEKAREMMFDEARYKRG